MRRASFLVVAPLLLSGCYKYATVQPGEVLPGTGVRARVSAATAERIAPLLGTTDARVLTGQLIENQSGTLLVEVPTVVQAGMAGATQTLSQRISIPRAELLELESRRLDKVRTGAVTAAIAAVAISSAVAAIRNNDPGTNQPGGGSSAPENRIPLFRLRF